MDLNMERFMEQRLENFVEHHMDNHLDHNIEHNARPGPPQCEVTMNNQGGDKLHFNGYSYSKKAISANAIRWTCATPTRSDTRCKGAITTDRERPYNNPRSLVEHNHPPEDSEASIMRDIARAKRRFRRSIYPHPFQFYPWMFPLHLQDQAAERNDAGSLDALNMSGDQHIHPSVAGPSGYMGDDVTVKMEPEWVDAGALEPNCELDGQYDDSAEFDNSGYQEDEMDNQEDDQRLAQMFTAPQQVQDARAPVKLHVPGKPNLTITVAPSRPASSVPINSNRIGSSESPFLNSALNRKRGRPRGSATYPGNFREMDEQPTYTESRIGQHQNDSSSTVTRFETSAAVASSSVAPQRGQTSTGKVQARTNDPESIRAAEIVNNTQSTSSGLITEELEKVCLRLRAEMLVLELENLKVEREKLAAFRRNVEVRRDIMKLHLELEHGIPSDVAASGGGSFSVPSSNRSTPDRVVKTHKKPMKILQAVSEQTRTPSTTTAKIIVRKSLQVAKKSTTSALSSPLNKAAEQVVSGSETKPVDDCWTSSNECVQVIDKPQQLVRLDSACDEISQGSVTSDLDIDMVQDLGTKRWTQTVSQMEDRGVDYDSSSEVDESGNVGTGYSNHDSEDYGNDDVINYNSDNQNDNGMNCTDNNDYDQDNPVLHPHERRPQNALCSDGLEDDPLSKKRKVASFWEVGDNAV